MDEVEAPVLQSNDPAAVVDSVEVPSQLFTTFTAGVDGFVLMVRYNILVMVQPASLVAVVV